MKSLQDIESMIDTSLLPPVSGDASPIQSESGMIWWIPVVAIVFFVFVFVFVLRNYLFRNKAQRSLRKEILKQSVDFDNIIKSPFLSEKLYNELKVRCHPDCFPTDKEKNRIANMLFQEISKNRHNWKRLLELKEQATRELNINF